MYMYMSKMQIKKYIDVLVNEHQYRVYPTHKEFATFLQKRVPYPDGDILPCELNEDKPMHINLYLFDMQINEYISQSIEMEFTGYLGGISTQIVFRSDIPVLDAFKQFEQDFIDIMHSTWKFRSNQFVHG